MSAVLEIDRLNTVFELRAGTVASVNDVSLTLNKGEIVGLVGESGSGKSVTGLSVLGLISEPGRIASGAIKLHGRDLVGLPEPVMRGLRGKSVSMIFQDPMTTLNPVLSIGRQFHEVINAHHTTPWKATQIKAEAALAEVGIPSPKERLKGYPHELSGGMRQRVCIALSLINEPSVVIADEPTTALDVTIEAQILAMMQRVVEQRQVAMIWITHDLSVVAGLCDRVAVMYGGRIVESGPVDEVLRQPAHPYTAGLLASIPQEDAPNGRLRQIDGTQPSPLALPSGCSFRTRCRLADQACLALPAESAVTDTRMVRCHRPLSGGS
ncbi:MAG: ABC transporter ATP-binding protein [Hyphomicrobiales bacterium]